MVGFQVADPALVDDAEALGCGCSFYAAVVYAGADRGRPFWGGPFQRACERLVLARKSNYEADDTVGFGPPGAATWKAAPRVPAERTSRRTRESPPRGQPQPPAPKRRSPPPPSAAAASPLKRARLPVGAAGELFEVGPPPPPPRATEDPTRGPAPSNEAAATGGRPREPFEVIEVRRIDGSGTAAHQRRRPARNPTTGFGVPLEFFKNLVPPSN